MCNNERDIYQVIEDEINASAFSESEKETRLNKLHCLSEKKLNIMFVGATGSGKSSTINALFDMERARVGTGVDPETDEIDSYRLQNVTIYDTPGLGDGVEKDERTMRMIREKMCEEDRDGNAVIDAVAVIIDSSQKDLGTVYDCIKKVLIPTLGDEAERRIVIALNQADMAMKGRHWIDEINHPDDVLKEFLEKKAEAVRERILASTGVNIHPVCYCAGYKEENGEQRKPYNLSKLLYTITMSVPTEKRLAIVDAINSNDGNWEADDDYEDYRRNVEDAVCEVATDFLADYADAGFDLGSTILGVPGGIIGGVIGGIVGGIRKAVDAFWNL